MRSTLGRSSAAGESRLGPGGNRHSCTLLVQWASSISQSNVPTKISVPGALSRLSRVGMVHAGVSFEPGDLIERESQTPARLPIVGITRNRRATDSAWNSSLRSVLTCALAANRVVIEPRLRPTKTHCWHWNRPIGLYPRQ